ncbi:MAG: cupin domain-containing protein [Actinophytocola sp.]|uniref:cupin domain-containing protein n=1 Tax=Actinophytocola sp. TaxID=1872138 RepID=UPI001326F801|nr:cupin domain-containing protein [Actinophytocola sp.]MPZ83507.1 cupin domain-containing protein [Actinophytocola sp.]
MTAQQVHHCAPGDGDELVSPDATITVKVGARHTGGGYELFEVDAPRGPAVPPHREPWGKAFYVLHGRLLVQAGDQGYDPGPGASIAIPPRTVNTFTVLTPSARFLVVSTGGMGEFFADLDRGGPAVEVAAGHGVEVA